MTRHLVVMFMSFGCFNKVPTGANCGMYVFSGTCYLVGGAFEKEHVTPKAYPDLSSKFTDSGDFGKTGFLCCLAGFSFWSRSLIRFSHTLIAASAYMCWGKMWNALDGCHSAQSVVRGNNGK